MRSIYQSPLWHTIMRDIYQLPTLDIDDTQIIIKKQKKWGIPLTWALCQGVSLDQLGEIHSALHTQLQRPLFVQYGCTDTIATQPTHETKRDAIISLVQQQKDSYQQTYTCPIPHSRRYDVSTPGATIVINTAISDDARRQEMSQSGRRQYRKAIKAGITVSQSTTRDDRKTFHALWHETATHQGFGIRDQEKIVALGRYLTETDNGSLRLSRDTDDNICAAAIVLHDTPTRSLYYLYGASTKQRSTSSAPYLMHQTIADRGHAQEMTQGYDLGGVASLGATDSSRASLTQFKRALGGAWIEYAGSVDMITHRIGYSAYQLIKRRKKKQH